MSATPQVQTINVSIQSRKTNSPLDTDVETNQRKGRKTANENSEYLYRPYKIYFYYHYQKQKKNSNGLTSYQQANFRQDNCELHIWAPFPSL